MESSPVEPESGRLSVEPVGKAASSCSVPPLDTGSVPDKCLEPEVFWAMARPDRASYRKKLGILLGRIPEQYLCPTADDCLTMDAARRLREAGRPLELVVTYPEAVSGSVYRDNQAMGKKG